MNIKTNIKTLIISLSFIIFYTNFSFSWTYPLKQVSKPTVNCKFVPWNSLSSDCKMTLPILKPSDYRKYLNNMTYRNIYTVLWASSYKY